MDKIRADEVEVFNWSCGVSIGKPSESLEFQDDQT